MPFSGKRLLGHIVRFWRFLERPPARVTDEAGRKNVVLLARLQLSILVLAFILAPTPDLLVNPSGFFRAPTNWAVLSGILAMMGCWLLNRIGGFYKIAALLTGVLFAAFALLLTPALTDGRFLWTLYYLVVPVMVCSLFFRARWTALLAICEMLAICLMPLAFPSIDPQGLPVVFFGMVSGLILIMVTHTKNLEQVRGDELAASRELYRGLLETLFDAVALVRDGAVVQANPGFARLFGLGEGELRALPVAHLVAAWPSVQPGEVMETTGVGANGAALDIELVCNRVKGGDAETFLLAVRDISERKRANLERERLVAAIEQAAESVVITGVDGAIQYVNPAFERLTGYSREEAVGQNPRVLKSGEQDASFYRDMWDTLTQGKTWEGRMANRAKDGSRFVEDATISPVCDPRGVIVNYVAVKHDITEHLREHEQKAKLEEQLVQAQRMESIGRFAGGVAHDLNNVLAIILGYGEVLEAEVPPGSRLAEPIGEINAAGQRAIQLTRQLLAFSRRQVLEVRPLDLNAVVGDFEKMLRRLLREDIEMTVLLSPVPRFVKADTTQIEQVLMNLCINARDAMPKGGRLTIEVGRAVLDEPAAALCHGIAPGAYATLTVTDTGCGMDEDLQKRIFEPFFTTKEKGMGTGLGLCTVFGIVKQHGGGIVVRSAPGQGTVFTVHIPALADASGQTLFPREPEPAKGNGETVLVLEDEPSVRKLVCRMLRDLGYRPIETADAEECIAVAKTSEKVDLLLTDIIMPGMDGCEVRRQVAALRPGIGTLFMSGYTDDILARHGFEEMGSQFIAKPFTHAALARKICEALHSGPGGLAGPDQ